MERKNLFGAQSRYWTPLENEFLAENEMIDIIPNFSCPKRHFMQGSYGPFHANRVIAVPLWLAITLKKSKKCRIKLPDWMNEIELKHILEQEKEDEKFCDGLPFYYREISKIIFDIDTENDHKKVRVLIQDIEDVRESKTRKGLKNLQSSTYIVHLNHISSNEINKNIRINVCNLLNYFYDITKVGPQSDQSSTQNTMNTSHFSQSTFNSSVAHHASYPHVQQQQQQQQENDFNSSNHHNHNSHQPMRKLRRLR